MIIPSTRKVGDRGRRPGHVGQCRGGHDRDRPGGGEPAPDPRHERGRDAGGTTTRPSGRAGGRGRRTAGAGRRRSRPRSTRRSPTRPGSRMGRRSSPPPSSLGVATPSLDPTTLVGSEVAEFELGLRARGLSWASIRGRSRRLPTPASGPRSTTAFGSSRPHLDRVGDPIVAGSVITFPVTVRAIQVRMVDGPRSSPGSAASACRRPAPSWASTARSRSPSGRTG